MSDQQTSTDPAERTDKARAALHALSERVLRPEFDYPGDAPVHVTNICDVCKAESSGPRDLPQHTETCALTLLNALLAERESDGSRLRWAVRNIRMFAARALSFGHQATPQTPEKMVERKEHHLRKILACCADVGETGSILREAEAELESRREQEPTKRAWSSSADLETAANELVGIGRDLSEGLAAQRAAMLLREAAMRYAEAVSPPPAAPTTEGEK